MVYQKIWLQLSVYRTKSFPVTSWTNLALELLISDLVESLIWMSQKNSRTWVTLKGFLLPPNWPAKCRKLCFGNMWLEEFHNNLWFSERQYTAGFKHLAPEPGCLSLNPGSTMTLKSHLICEITLCGVSVPILQIKMRFRKFVILPNLYN